MQKLGVVRDHKLDARQAAEVWIQEYFESPRKVRRIVDAGAPGECSYLFQLVDGTHWYYVEATGDGWEVSLAK